MSDPTQGLYGKFYVRRVDGRDQPGGDKAGAEYFVLDITHDTNARLAAMFYAALSQKALPILSSDLMTLIERVTETHPVEYDLASAQALALALGALQYDQENQRKQEGEGDAQTAATAE